jgi:hypothetical protein
VILELPDGLDNKNWIIGNVKHAGFYRVNYDDKNWNLLVQQLQNDHEKIDPVNRATLIDDSFNLGKAELIDQLKFFELIKYLTKEEDPLPFEPAFYGLNSVAGLVSDDFYANSLFKVSKYLLKINLHFLIPLFKYFVKNCIHFCSRNIMLIY